MNKSFLKVVPILLSVLSIPSQAEEQVSNSDAGFLIGGGFFSAANSSCTDCGYSGQAIEIGYDFNNIVGIEAKYASGDSDDDYDLKVNYAGVNLGHDFNTEWFRLYGKIGYASVKEEGTESWFGYTESWSDSGVTFGVGTRFTFSGKASGLYLKLESMAIGYEYGTTGAAALAGLGYRF